MSRPAQAPLDLALTCLRPGEGAVGAPAEVVERKGTGHPDTICDALAERLGLSLSRFYLERAGAIHHHNVDKALLWSGVSRPRFGGGRVLEPMEIFLAGRATLELGGVRVPVEELAVEGSRAWLREHLPALDPVAHAVVRPLVRPGSAELVELYARGAKTGRWLANDTSIGVGYAPLSELETVVGAVERTLSGAARDAGLAAIGQDVKVMGVRRDGGIALTVGCALVDRHLANLDDYLATRERVASLARESARRVTRCDVAVQVNAADDPGAGSLFLTVTGTSAEAGDDGGAGRGNRANGLITPGRPMTLESLAGKNPITHVGKLYNLLAALASAALVEAIPELAEARCLLVSRIGQPIREPQLAHVTLVGREALSGSELRPRVAELLADQLAGIDRLWEELVAGTLAIDRWPLRKPD